MKVIADSWNHSYPEFGKESSLNFDYRVFMQDEQWLLDGAYFDLAMMTPDQLFGALEALFCTAESHYKGMLHWYENQYNQTLRNNSISGSAFLGFLTDYQQVLGKTPHEWLRDSLLCQAIEDHLTGDND